MREWESGVSFAFLVLTGLVAIYTVFEVVKFPFALRAGPTQIEPGDLKSFQMIQLEPLEKYKQEFSTHTLFSKPKAQAVTPELSNLDEMLKPYVLTGIVQGIEPEALIQNTFTKQIHFVQAGEPFDQFKLIEIKEHSVLVARDGEERELHLNYV